MVGELHLRSNEIQQEPIQTIYIGGGTPSLLNATEINRLIDQVTELSDCSNLQEITLETNPDDLTKDYIHNLKQTPINRFSIGVQSFFNEDLVWMNRAHNQDQAIHCIENAQNAGFENITIDLIYGSPTTTDEMWQKNLDIWQSLNLPHLSAYCLTVEEKTALHHQIKIGQSKPISDEHSFHHFSMLQSFCESNHVEQYEISNYAKNKRYSIHNSNYWKGEAYIGIGPSAHSFDGKTTRSWNVPNNNKYIQSITEKAVFWEEETLDEIDLINEHIMIKLRTKWGIHPVEFLKKFSQRNFDLFKKNIQLELQNGRMELMNDTYSIKRDYLFQTDDIIANLFFEKT